MWDEIERSTNDYYKKWDQLVGERSNKTFFEQLKPIAIGWKVEDRAAYDTLYAEIHDKCDRIIETWMNGRWIAKMHLNDSALPGGVTILKVMQRRPGSTDAVGLDHVDFFTKDSSIQSIVEQETGLKWSLESNSVIAGYEWISIWFNGTEAKIKSDTVIDIIIKELEEINHQITAI